MPPHDRHSVLPVQTRKPPKAICGLITAQNTQRYTHSVKRPPPPRVPTMTYNELWISAATWRSAKVIQSVAFYGVRIARALSTRADNARDLINAATRSFERAHRRHFRMHNESRGAAVARERQWFICYFSGAGVFRAYLYLTRDSRQSKRIHRVRAVRAWILV